MQCSLSWISREYVKKSYFDKKSIFFIPYLTQADMVFYNKILRAYVLIELKTKKLTPEAAGQLNMYLNYYAAEVNDHDDNPPIGIILCTDKDGVAAEYALGGLSNNIFASRYVLYMPDKEQLVAQVEAVLKKWHDKNDGNQ